MPSFEASYGRRVRTLCKSAEHNCEGDRTMSKLAVCPLQTTLTVYDAMQAREERSNVCASRGWVEVRRRW